MQGLIGELQRRNVFRVAMLYLVASWVTLQMADVGVSLLGLPGWTGRLVVLLLAIGFPVAVVVAWAYELTPDGLKRDHAVPPEESIAHVTGRKLDLLIVAVSVLAILVVAADRFIPRASQSPQAIGAAAAVASAPPAIDTRSIAVLPFVNMSEDASNVYFSEGLSEDLINSLARLPRLRVIGRTSSFQFKDKQADVRAIGEALGVATVLEGSVQKLDERVRVNAQLVSTADGSEVWADTFERDLGDAFAIQDDIVAEVVKALRMELAGPGARRDEAPSDPEAYTLALKGRYFLNRNTRADLRKAAEFYRAAIAQAPDYAKAWAGLAGVYYAQTSYNHLPVSVGLKAMRAAVARALQLDPDLPAGHHMLAAIQKDYDWDWAGAERSIARAQRLAPGNPDVLRQAGTLKMIRGSPEDAIALYRQSLELDPLQLTTLNNLAIAQYYQGHLDDAAGTIAKLVELNPHSDGAPYLAGLVALAQGRAPAALAAFEREPPGLWRLQGEALAYHAMGRADASDAALARMTERFGGDSAFQVAEVHAFRGDNDAAMAWLERAYDQRDGGLSEVRGDPLLRGLQPDPRYRAFLGRMGLAPAGPLAGMPE